MLKKPAFTLIELLVTVSIMAMLSGLVMINIYGNIAKGRDAKRKNDLRELRTSLELYFSINNEYPPTINTNWPPDFSSANGIIEGCGTLVNKLRCDWGTPFVQSGVTYMANLPVDPKGSQSYYYERNPYGKLSYIIVAKLERANDPDIAKSQANCPNVFGTGDPGTNFPANSYAICDAQ